VGSGESKGAAEAEVEAAGGRFTPSARAGRMVGRSRASVNSRRIETGNGGIMGRDLMRRLVATRGRGEAAVIA
jgi:hypothetical protein